jgi:DNA primase
MPGDIDRIKQLSDIMSVIGRHIDLKQSGSSLKGICPFHNEKTPSFHVFPGTGTWHCFGCGAGGDVITFVMRYGNLTFREALEELADQCGITLEGRGTWTGPETGLLDALRDAQKWFVEKYRSSDGAAARRYVEGRGLSPVAEALGIGYSCEGLSIHMRERGYSDSQLEQAGLLVPGTDSRRDRFRNRLTFPIRDRRGRTVSFGGRTLTDSGPKYLNGPDTEVYHKGSILYGYSDAAPAARETGMVILVEGYFDHARIFASGFPAVVATCGTALTEIQARTLRTMAEDTLICYDGDEAGTRAAVKAAVAVLTVGGLPRVIRLPGGMDPDDLIASRGMEAFMELVERAPGPIGFCVSLLPGGFPGGVAGVRAAKRLMEIVSAASDPLTREQLLMEVEKTSGFSRASLENHLVMKHGQEQKRLPEAVTERELDRADRAIISAVVGGGALDSSLLRWLEPDDFKSEPGRSIFLALRGQMDEGCTTVSFGMLTPEQGSICSRLASSMTGMKPGDRETIVKRVENDRLKSLRTRIKQRLAGASPEEMRELLGEIGDLDRRRHAGKE